MPNPVRQLAPLPPQKRFPIQGETRTIGWAPARLDHLAPITVPWSVAEAAYAVYSRLYGTRQSLERLAERGGFGRDELLWLLNGGVGR